MAEEQIKYGLSATGFRRKRLTDIRKSINSRLTDSLGTSIQTASNSVLGQLVGVFSFEIADLWEQAENTYNAMYPSTAQGTSLSNAAGLAGIQLIEPEYTTLTATCVGANGTEIPYGAQISDGTYTYSCTDVYEQILSSRANLASIKIAGTVTPKAAYTLTIDGQVQTYTATASDTAANVLIQLAALFSLTDRTFAVNNDTLLISMKDPSKTMRILVGDTLQLAAVGSPFTFQCDSVGAIVPAIGTVTQIVTTYAGWTSVENAMQAVSGRNAETDISLRQRWGASVYDRASAMVEAIRAALLKVDGVTFAIVYENNTDVTDEMGRPPHSVEAVVSGGTAQDIGSTIWRTHAGGITTHGTESVKIYDSQGISHIMRFNRPTEVPIYLDITIRENPEKELAGDAVSSIRAAVINYSKSFLVGQDVILQAFYGTIYAATSGAVGYMEIKASKDGKNYSTSNVIISARELAVLSAERIRITL